MAPYRWPTLAASLTLAELETARWRRSPLPEVSRARLRHYEARWKSQNHSVFTIPASRRTARRCRGTAPRRKCEFKRTPPRFKYFTSSATMKISMDFCSHVRRRPRGDDSVSNKHSESSVTNDASDTFGQVSFFVTRVDDYSTNCFLRVFARKLAIVVEEIFVAVLGLSDWITRLCRISWEYGV